MISLMYRSGFSPLRAFTVDVTMSTSGKAMRRLSLPDAPLLWFASGLIRGALISAFLILWGTAHPSGA